MSLLRLTGALLGLLLAACSDSNISGPSSISEAKPAVHDPQILVGGSAIQGTVWEGTDEPMLFRVRVEAPDGLQSIDRVVLEFSQPGRNHEPLPTDGGFVGQVPCYDDGTHGDSVAGDGIYHYFDPRDQIGCAGTEAPEGEYRYTFWCEDVLGRVSDEVTVTIVRSSVSPMGPVAR